MDKFGDRMKGYENTYRMKLPKRMPVLIRIDGKAFTKYTKGMKKPFDKDLTDAMWRTCIYLAQNIMGCKHMIQVLVKWDGENKRLDIDI
ncbi:tRNA(His) guanylyltransferase Thg1 family protein [Bacillus phage vB_BsuS_PJN02]|uniref:tRNA(His) guanylyltransferase Thg1 family protein n=1 Tax=Bacillus phage vB_BsuS_PJN02 TaxID=2920374 RepID=A0AC61TS61_9CAUD|nr:tRNA(His) guanylyltransferase Thg1 family protein [Bacillus phage vB_BsuS_PJN02]UNH58528.1 tRNA(His) guanylyltransferase Thg1 family protein [Bacillus phage vB_BsuS_PJN02]